MLPVARLRIATSGSPAGLEPGGRLFLVAGRAAGGVIRFELLFSFV
jgi:hypothetical protein